jgi:hypothetical protein
VSFPFDPADPFPLISLQSVTYADQKEHARQADAFFGFEIEASEARLKAKTESQKQASQWIGLDPASLQTPYLEIRFMLSVLNLNSGDEVVDLGCGYGRMGLVMHRHFPESRFLGFEIAETRVQEGMRVYGLNQVQNARLIAADVTAPEFQIPKAKVYFLYDLSQLASIRKVIEGLKKMAKAHSITVIGRGRATRDQIERNEPWLSKVVEPEHHGNFTVYRS